MDVDLRDIAYVPTTGVRQVREAPLVAATPDSLRGYGCLVEEPQAFPIEIVRWPAQGWRPVDENSGDQGGVTEGLFEFWWKGETLYARNNAVGDSYLFGWSNWPEEAATTGALLPPQPRELRGPAGSPGRRRSAGEVYRLLVRRHLRPLHPPQYLAWRGRAA